MHLFINVCYEYVLSKISPVIHIFRSVHIKIIKKTPKLKKI